MPVSPDLLTSTRLTSPSSDRGDDQQPVLAARSDVDDRRVEKLHHGGNQQQRAVPADRIELEAGLLGHVRHDLAAEGADHSVRNTGEAEQPWWWALHADPL